MTSTEPDIVRQSVVRRLLTQTALWVSITGAVLFAAAGTVRWPEAWIYLAIWLTAGLTSGLTLAYTNPEIIAERLRPPIRKDQKAWDKPIMLLLFGGWFATHVVAGFDAVRFGWSHMPAWLEAVGAALLILGIYIFHVVMRENSFASTSVRVQRDRGHRVISTGPYAWVRHPMYAGSIPYFVGTTLLLGSWLALLLALALSCLLALRAVWEEETLSAELDGYADYAERVRYRIIPGVW